MDSILIGIALANPISREVNLGLGWSDFPVEKAKVKRCDWPNLLVRKESERGGASVAEVKVQSYDMLKKVKKVKVKN